MKLYVGMGLTQAPKEFRENFQNEIKTELRNIPEVEVLDFIGLEGSTEEEVYTYDRNCAQTADLCVFIVDYPSIGLGMEISFRLATGKPMLVFAKEGMSVTRMLTGMCSVENIPFHRYDSAEEVTAVVKWSLG